MVDAAIAPLREKLAAINQVAASEQRRLATILLADLVGFTRLSERLDAEELREVQQAYFAAISAPARQLDRQVYRRSDNGRYRFAKRQRAFEVLVSHDSYRHVRAVFDFQVQPLLAVKSKTEPMRTYLALRAKPRAFRMATHGVEGFETLMIGRQAELRQLQALYQIALQQSQTQIVTIGGEPGIGKSRLLYEFEQWVEPSAPAAPISTTLPSAPDDPSRCVHQPGWRRARSGEIGAGQGDQVAQIHAAAGAVIG